MFLTENTKQVFFFLGVATDLNICDLRFHITNMTFESNVKVNILKSFFVFSCVCVFFLLTVPPGPFQGGASFVDLFCYLSLMFIFVMVYCLVLSVSFSPVITCWERADLLALYVLCFLVCLSLSHMLFRVRYGT